MKEFTHADTSQISGAKNWGYAFILLAAVSAFFLTLRLIGLAFIVPEFEVLVIYLPTVICLLIYVTMVQPFPRANL
jgi:hypothetical protein